MNVPKKYRYQLKTLSKLVLSPREHQGYYLAAGDFDVKLSEEFQGNTNIIYPFYQYGSYKSYNPEQAQYYIPGSSIKGAICSGSEKTYRLMVDDIQVDRSRIKLNYLYKLQHYTGANNKQTKLEEFFPKIKVEMLSAGSICYGVFFSEGDPGYFLKKAQSSTRDKLKQLQGRIDSIDYSHVETETKGQLIKLKDNLTDIIMYLEQKNSRKYILLLGGYKGLLLSGIFNKEVEKSAIYLDKDSSLPHGLVQIMIEDEYE